ncbi:TolC family protein [Putridiphycobacter roseus]|nr:TolC family protein [Putridiphycobacter roseus]
MKSIVIILLFMLYTVNSLSQSTLNDFIVKSKWNSPAISEIKNLIKIKEIQSKLIDVQNKASTVSFTSDLYFSPYFNNKEQLISISNSPDQTAVGYDINVSNGGLYSTQLNITKNLLNNRLVENLQFQNYLQIGGDKLNHKLVQHNLEKQITDSYILAYQIQMQDEFLSNELLEIQKRIDLVEILTQKGIVQESDLLLLQLEQSSKQTARLQIKANFNNALNQLYNLSNLAYADSTYLVTPIIPLNSIKDTLYLDEKYKNDSLLIEANTHVFNNQYKPQLNLYANTGVNSADIKHINHHFGISGGIRLSIPIYDGGQKNIFSQQQHLYQENLMRAKKSDKIKLNNNLNSLQNQIDQTKKNIEALDAQLVIQQKIRNLYQIKLTKGQVSIVDFLNISRDFRQTQFLKIQIQTNLWLLYSQFNYINW